MIRNLISRRGQLLCRQMAQDLVKLKIDGKDVSVPKGTLLVEAIKKAGSNVPTICYHPDLPTSVDYAEFVWLKVFNVQVFQL